MHDLCSILLPCDSTQLYMTNLVSQVIQSDLLPVFEHELKTTCGSLGAAVVSSFLCLLAKAFPLIDECPNESDLSLIEILKYIFLL